MKYSVSQAAAIAAACPILVEYYAPLDCMPGEEAHWRIVTLSGVYTQYTAAGAMDKYRWHRKVWMHEYNRQARKRGAEELTDI